MIAACREPDRTKGRELMHQLIDSVSVGVPNALTEVTTTLGRTLIKRAADVMAYFDRPGTPNGPTDAINGRLKHLRGSALGFRNLNLGPVQLVVAGKTQSLCSRCTTAVRCETRCSAGFGSRYSDRVIRGTALLASRQAASRCMSSVHPESEPSEQRWNCRTVHKKWPMQSPDSRRNI